MDKSNTPTDSELTKKFGYFTAAQDMTFNIKKGEPFSFLGVPGSENKTPTKKFGTFVAQEDMTLDVKKGEIFGFLGIPGAENNGEVVENIIEVKNLVKKFGRFTAVDDVTFNVKKGEIFGFLGPNGAGKSTTIRILTTLSMPTAGSAKVAGYDVVHQQDQVRRHIGLVAEKVILYNHLTADENLEFFGSLYHLPRRLVRERAEKWLPRLHMMEWRKHQVGTFSTGMKQRINIIRALLTEPDVLFLDEPTLGLDPQTTHVIQSFLRELNDQGVTIVLTTHDMNEAEDLSDRVAIIDHGKIAALDTVPALKTLVHDVEDPSMEDVFLKITGEEIRDTAGSKVVSRGRRHF